MALFVFFIYFDDTDIQKTFFNQIFCRDFADVYGTFITLCSFVGHFAKYKP